MGGCIAQDEAIAVQRGNRPLQDELRQTARAGRQRLRIEQHDPGLHGGRADVQVHGSAMRECQADVARHVDMDVEPVSRRMHFRRHDPVAAYRLGVLQADADQIQCTALAGDRAVGRPVPGMNRANPGFCTPG